MFMPVQNTALQFSLLWKPPWWRMYYSRVVSGRTSKREWASIKLAMKSGFV